MHAIQINRRQHRRCQMPRAEMVRTVSATSMDTEAEVRSMPRPSVPNYALRRLAVGLGAVVCCAVVVVASIGIVAGFGTSAVASDAPASRPAPSAYVAETGDTLWSIAAAHRGDIGHDRYLDALIGKNGGGVDIRVGQVVWLP